MSNIDYSRYKVSIIIPVYNAESYLEECLDSILLQKHILWEVILVDDESTDRSPEIIETYCRTDFRFKGVRISNHGPAYARNVGLEQSTGDFILFVDNDDLLAPNALYKLLRAAIQYKAEVVVGNTICFGEGECYLYRKLNHSQGGIQTGLAYFDYAINEHFYTVMLYNYMYRRSFIESHQLRFDSHVIHEDELWTPQALIAAERVIPTNIVHYYYRQRSDSLSKHIPSEKWHDEAEYITAKLMELAKEQEQSKLARILHKRINQINAYVKMKTF